MKYSLVILGVLRNYMLFLKETNMQDVTLLSRIFKGLQVRIEHHKKCGALMSQPSFFILPFQKNRIWYNF